MMRVLYGLVLGVILSAAVLLGLGLHTRHVFCQSQASYTGSDTLRECVLDTPYSDGGFIAVGAKDWRPYFTRG